MSILEGVFTLEGFDYNERYRLNPNDIDTRTAFYWTKSYKDNNNIIISCWDGNKSQWDNLIEM